MSITKEVNKAFLILYNNILNSMSAIILNKKRNLFKDKEFDIRYFISLTKIAALLIQTYKLYISLNICITLKILYVLVII